MSDEYGPYIYKFDASGALLQAIEPPAAILPILSDGSVNFTSVTDPATGRVGNQGTFTPFHLSYLYKDLVSVSPRLTDIYFRHLTYRIRRSYYRPHSQHHLCPPPILDCPGWRRQ